MKKYKSSDLTHKRAEVLKEAKLNGIIIQQLETNGQVRCEFLLITKLFDIGIGFTKDEILTLISKIEDLNDEGPYNSGWQSQELLDLISKLNKASEGFQ